MWTYYYYFILFIHFFINNNNLYSYIKMACASPYCMLICAIVVASVSTSSACSWQYIQSEHLIPAVWISQETESIPTLCTQYWTQCFERELKSDRACATLIESTYMSPRWTHTNSAPEDLIPIIFQLVLYILRNYDNFRNFCTQLLSTSAWVVFALVFIFNWSSIRIELRLC